MSGGEPMPVESKRTEPVSQTQLIPAGSSIPTKFPTDPGFRSFWETCSKEALSFRIFRLNRALPYCRGRAADCYQLVFEHIKFLEGIKRKRFGVPPSRAGDAPRASEQCSPKTRETLPRQDSRSKEPRS